MTQEPAEMGRAGGVSPLLYSTLIINGFSVILVLMLGLPVALFLARSAIHKAQVQIFVRLPLDLLAATPSIVFGLFGHALFSRALGLGYSLLSGILTLTIMILPLFVRLCEDAIRELPADFRLVSRSLGISEATYSFKILLPSLLPALTAALILAWSRAVGETAALLFTAGYSMRWPDSLLDSGRTLSVHIFDLSLNITGADQKAYEAAFLLFLLTTIFVLVCRLLTKGLIRWRYKHLLS